MKRKSTGSIFLLGIFLVLAAVSASAQSVTLNPKTASFTYDSQTEATQAVTVTSKMANGEPELNYYLSVDPASSSRLFTSGTSSDTIPFQVYNAPTAPRSAVLSISEALSASDVVTGAFSGTKPVRRAANDIYFTVPVGGFATAGTYTASITVNLWSGTFNTGIQAASAVLSATLQVATILNLSVVPVGAPFDYSATSAVFDFGVLETGKEYSADLIARANTIYGVALSSKNGGLLTNTDAADPSTVPYALFVNGTELALSAGQSVPLVSSAAKTNPEGIRYRLRTLIKDFDFPSDGTYTDTLTLSIVQN